MSEQAGLLSIRDASAYLDVPTHDIRNALESGELPGVKHGTEWQVRREDLDAWNRHEKHISDSEISPIEANQLLRDAS